MLETPFAAVSSSGEFTSDGVIASCAGRNGVPAMADRVASTKTAALGASQATHAAVPSISAARTASQDTIRDLREIRSASAAPNGVSTAASVSRTVPQMPTAAAPPTP